MLHQAPILLKNLERELKTMDIEKLTAEVRPFDKQIFEALSFKADQVRKVDVSIGPRSQTVIFKFALTPEQLAQLDAMASS